MGGAGMDVPLFAAAHDATHTSNSTCRMILFFEIQKTDSRLYGKFALRPKFFCDLGLAVVSRHSPGGGEQFAECKYAGRAVH